LELVDLMGFVGSKSYGFILIFTPYISIWDLMIYTQQSEINLIWDLEDALKEAISWLWETLQLFRMYAFYFKSLTWI